MFTKFAHLVLVMALPPAAVQAAERPDQPSYLAGATLMLPVVPAPAADGDAGLVDLYLVRQTQRDAGAAARTEAFDDAAAYYFDDLMPRFSEAAGAEAPLGATNHPVMAHVLRALLNDVMFYSSAAKTGRPRTRPFAETAPTDAAGEPLVDAEGRLTVTSEIAPCFTYKLRAGGSYPSGHAANGYAAALALAEAMPARRAALLARGARYGDNRVVCGVHHPVDVERGRAVARIVFAAAGRTPAFRRDIACARAEAAGIAGDAGCAALRETYGAEMTARRIERLCADLSATTRRPAACAAAPAATGPVMR